MKPNEANAALPTSERPCRVLIISGSSCRQVINYRKIEGEQLRED